MEVTVNKDFEEWFRSKQGEPYDSMYCFAKDAWIECSNQHHYEIKQLKSHIEHLYLEQAGEDA